MKKLLFPCFSKPLISPESPLLEFYFLDNIVEVLTSSFEETALKGKPKTLQFLWNKVSLFMVRPNSEESRTKFASPC